VNADVRPRLARLPEEPLYFLFVYPGPDALFVMLKLMSGQPLIRTTVALPADPLTAIDRFVSEGRVVSRNELVVDGLRAHVQQLERAARDAEFQAMTDAAAYQAEARQILGEFAGADRDLGFAFGSASPCE
jgi:Arc/MetJ-type ribon-helix-helix transcriptional regulator